MSTTAVRVTKTIEITGAASVTSAPWTPRDQSSAAINNAPVPIALNSR